jgi:hypothetical protein
MEQSERQQQQAVIQGSRWVDRGQEEIARVERHPPAELIVVPDDRGMVPRVEVPIIREDLELRLILHRDRVLWVLFFHESDGPVRIETLSDNS